MARRSRLPPRRQLVENVQHDREQLLRLDMPQLVPRDRLDEDVAGADDASEDGPRAVNLTLSVEYGLVVEDDLGGGPDHEGEGGEGEEGGVER